MRYTVDRFEGESALLIDETGVVSVTELGALPPCTREGDVLYDGPEGFVLDPASRAAAERRISEKLAYLRALRKK